MQCYHALVHTFNANNEIFPEPPITCECLLSHVEHYFFIGSIHLSKDL